MSKRTTLILLIFLAVTLGFSPQIHASSGSYVVFRANVSPMYIMNVSAPIHVIAIPFHDNKPIYGNLQLYIMINGINVNYTYKTTIQIPPGRQNTIYLPAMAEGHYNITLYTDYNGIKSMIIKEDFAVVPAPLPYELTFSNDGSKIIFKSKVLNQTGQIDPNTTFRLEIYVWDGIQENLVDVFTNVTNLTINVPASWKTGILIVDVVDQYGWRNGMSVDLAHFQFQGYPAEYDYEQIHRYPLAGRSWPWYVGVLIFILVMLTVAKRWLGDGGSGEE
ncbi:hypothetical protein AciM339_0218 [Aciduliprofundum sp. MAR08-339]|uniref:hypothetical protein n=1 Tax=Aciduliprofundum sp. (strain MAR08-339) TaxID=673860 RepID=UPI0002A48FC1|nr:hypothetical protein AciM339_0186 [Aciduliprofundum sp. MAR08-339]AGB04115.1 hypothetical protein AciM339_0218 [Aciduliprofundum sp. MAR08-339]